MFPSTPEQWAYFLGTLGVRAPTAAVWCEAFAAQVTPDRFNQGERELDDFMAETLHETDYLAATEENLSYRPERIRELGTRYGPKSRWFRAATDATRLAGNPRELAEVLYGGRFGNTRPGDGYLYRGRGIPMVTFHDNYARLADLTGLDLVRNPDLLCEPENAVRCAVLWWEDKIPDDAIDHPERVRQLVQGSTLGLDNTRMLSAKARATLATMA